MISRQKCVVRAVPFYSVYGVWLVFVSGFDESRSALSGVVLLLFLSLILRLAGLLSISFILPAVLYATIFIFIDRLFNSE